MRNPTDSPLLLFYPTSPVHVRDMLQMMEKLSGWRCQAIDYGPLARVAPGIGVALSNQAIDTVKLGHDCDFDKKLPEQVAVLALGAVFEPFALELFAWAKQRGIPVIAIQEVAQLALNRADINNYDAPFDRLFVASPDEQEKYLSLGYPSYMLSVSGLLANDRFAAKQERSAADVLGILGVADGKQPIVYTTSPLRSRLALHNKDDLPFRQAILAQLALAGRRTGQRVVVKLHPNEDIEAARQEILKIIPDAIVVCREINMDELFPASGVLVNRGNSQTCLEAVLRGVPTVVAACGLKTLFHDDGGAYVVNDVSELAETIERAGAKGPADISQVKAKHYYLPPEGVAGFIAKEITDIAACPQPANEKTWNWLIKSMLFIGRHDRALQFCGRIESRGAWQEAVRIALQARADGQLQSTITAWRQCSALEPNWFFPHYELAHGYQASEDYHRAIEHARKAIALHPPFHSLWHEIPMRVVIMNSLRRTGNRIEAEAIMKVLEERGLVKLIPELLIERGIQLGAIKDRMEKASRCLNNAIDQLKVYPVHESVDAELRERALDQVRELAKQYERDRRYPLAEQGYTRLSEFHPDDLWIKYLLARAQLMQGKLFTAPRHLHGITRIPNGPRSIIDKIASINTTHKLDRCWPATPRSILRPIKLATWVAAWAIAKLLRSGFKELADAATASLLIAIFVIEHFSRRLSSEVAALRRTFRMLRAGFPRNSAYRFHLVKSCPICGGHGRFEYQNKLTPLLRCSQCDHVYASQLPDDEVLSSLYGDVSYWEKDRMHQGITTMQESAEWEVYLKARLGILQRLELLPCSQTAEKAVFEIGCAEGMLLHALQKRGMRVGGCEMNRAVAAQGMKTLGVDIRTEPFETLALPRHDCDLVISFHTLEHMRFPVNVLAKIAQMLRSDGSLLIEVPCGEEEYENTDHLHFFSKTSLRLLIDKFFSSTEIIDNAYTNSAGVRIGSIYGVGRGVKPSHLHQR